MSDTISVSPAFARFFDFAEQNQFYLFPILADTKVPACPWKSGASPDPDQWREWVTARHMIGVNACASGIVIAEVDVKIGRPEAWQYFRDWCAHVLKIDADKLKPYCHSRSGGWHFAFRCPDDFDPAQHRGVISIQEQGAEVISIRNRGYCVAPGSVFGGMPYQLDPDAMIYAMPEAMLDMLQLPVIDSTANGRAGESDCKDVAGLVAFLDQHGEFDSEPEWFRALGAIKIACGDTEDGLLVARQITNDEATDKALMQRWTRLATAARPGDFKIGSLIHRAHALGWKGRVGKSAAAMFAGVVSSLPAVASPSIVPMFGGRGEKQCELWAPILGTLPTVERVATHPEMPDTGHPLRDAVNAAIPAIVADPIAHTDALAVVEAVHPQTAALVAAVTPAVKARAEALRQDAEHALIPSDYIRDHKGEIQRDNPDNVRFFLASLGVPIRWNEWIERAEVRGWEWRDWTVLDDTVVVRLRMRAGQTGTRFLPGKDFTWDALLSLAHDNPVDPARDLLDSFQSQWDGTHRLSLWLTQACGAPYDAYHQAVGTTILLGLVARIRNPGVKFDLMPVFVSETQGTSKSTLARMLALRDAWFVENVALGESAKELVLLLAGKSVAEISEMRTRGEVDAVKAMISATHDEGRPAYGRATVKRPRRHIFVGTTNRPEFLEDQTGGRRFLPIVVQGDINLDWLRTNLPQLIGEACALQARGVDINLPREVWSTAAAHQDAATAKATAEILLTDWFAGTDPCWIAPANLVLLLRHALGRTPTRGEYAQTMGRLGFVSRTRWDGEGSPRVWVRGNPSTRAPGYGPALNQDGRPRLQACAGLDAPRPGLTPLPSG